jgi:hypothetical protein
MRSSSSEPNVMEPADLRPSVARFSPTERVDAREPSGAITAEIAGEIASKPDRGLRTDAVERDHVVATTPTVR